MKFFKLIKFHFLAMFRGNLWILIVIAMNGRCFFESKFMSEKWVRNCKNPDWQHTERKKKNRWCERATVRSLEFVMCNQLARGDTMRTTSTQHLWVLLTATTNLYPKQTNTYQFNEKKGHTHTHTQKKRAQKGQRAGEKGGRRREKRLWEKFGIANEAKNEERESERTK